MSRLTKRVRLLAAPALQHQCRASFTGLVIIVLAAAALPAMAQSVNDTFNGSDADQRSWRDYYANYPRCRFLVRLQWATENNLFQANFNLINARTDAEKRPWRQRVRELTAQRTALDRRIIACGYRAPVAAQADASQGFVIPVHRPPVIRPTVRRQTPPIKGTFTPNCAGGAFEPICASDDTFVIDAGPAPQPPAPSPDQVRPGEVFVTPSPPQRPPPYKATKPKIRTDADAQQSARELGLFVDSLFQGPEPIWREVQREWNQKPK